MRIRTASDLVATVIVWLPIMAIIVFVGWVLASGLLQLETISFGTEYFIGNDETTNLPTPLGGASDEDLLMAALDSGDTEQMSAALDQLEQRQARVAG